MHRDTVIYVSSYLLKTSEPAYRRLTNTDTASGSAEARETVCEGRAWGGKRAEVRDTVCVEGAGGVQRRERLWGGMGWGVGEEACRGEGGRGPEGRGLVGTGQPAEERPEAAERGEKKKGRQME